MLPLYLPVRSGDEVTGLGLLTWRSTYSTAGSGCSPAAGPSRGRETVRGALIEGIIEESEDETLMDRYLGGEEI